ncbi:MAG: hypothetical protein K2X93_12010 [Candidatus Obscuribacterales bacterium]|nr:hypothetical protein [Candidatus Obscuribacterales bacterium]
MSIESIYGPNLAKSNNSNNNELSASLWLDKQSYCSHQSEDEETNLVKQAVKPEAENPKKEDGTNLVEQALKQAENTKRNEGTNFVDQAVLQADKKDRTDKPYVRPPTDNGGKIPYRGLHDWMQEAIRLSDEEALKNAPYLRPPNSSTPELLRRFGRSLFSRNDGTNFVDQAVLQGDKKNRTDNPYLRPVQPPTDNGGKIPYRGLHDWLQEAIKISDEEAAKIPLQQAPFLKPPKSQTPESLKMVGKEALSLNEGTNYVKEAAEQNPLSYKNIGKGTNYVDQAAEQGELERRSKNPYFKPVQPRIDNRGKIPYRGLHDWLQEAIKLSDEEAARIPLQNDPFLRPPKSSTPESLKKGGRDSSPRGMLELWQDDVLDNLLNGKSILPRKDERKSLEEVLREALRRR